MTELIGFSERALQPLDGLRRLCVRAAVRLPPFRRVLLRRETRVPALLAVHAVGAFVLALFVPSLLLAFAPLVLGVPHVAADVRHLIVRRALPRWWVCTIGVVIAALLLLRLLEESALIPLADLRLEHGLGALWILGGVAAGARLRVRSRPLLVVALVALAVAVGAFSLIRPHLFRLVFVHAHNLAAVGIWLSLFRHRLRHAWLPVVLVVVGGAVLTSGVLIFVPIQIGVLSIGGLHLFAAADWLAPGVPDAQAIGLTMSFAFLQSVHYAIWLVAIPRDDDKAGRGGFTFRKAGRSLTRDFSRAGVMLIGAAVMAMLAGAVVAPLKTRTLFLSLATFHGWLEVALLAFFAARGDLRGRALSRVDDRKSCP